MGVQFFDEHAGAITAVATLAIMGLTYAYVHISKQQWQVAQDSLSVSQRAYVTVGRKDGVIAEFVPPSKDKPDQATEIVIYFHNSGHVPARFTWGKLITLFAPPGSSRPSGIEYIPEYRPFVRIRNKDGSINESGASFTIAGDSDLVSTLGRISQKDLAELPGLNFWGEYMYCDELGNVDQRKFILSYRTNAPSSSLSFALTGDEPFPIPTFIPPRTDTSEGLNPCETSAEKIQNQQKQQTVSWYKPWTWF